MRKLLSAGFVRLMKDKAFWTWMAAVCVFAIYGTIMRSVGAPDAGPDFLFLLFPILISVLSAVFCSLFVGTEYSDGTIRNKIVVGHARITIYLSNLILCTVAGLLASLCHILAVAALGLPLLGPIQMDAGQFAVSLLAALAVVAAYGALFTMLCMSNQNKAHAIVVSVLTILALIVLSAIIYAKLQEPELYHEIAYSASSEDPIITSVPNPAYLSGRSRAIHQFFADFLPTGQALQFTDMPAQNPWLPYSLLFAAATTAIGLLLFRKKDLK